MKISIIAGDITKFTGDAIVNPANNLGLGGGGADGAIHRAAGPRLVEACRNLPIYSDLTGFGPNRAHTPYVRVPDGGAVPTPAFDLPCKWVIHTAGPVWPEDESAKVIQLAPVFLDNAQERRSAQLRATQTTAEAHALRLLHACYQSTLMVAVGMGMRSIAYPAISTGVYGCPMDVCAKAALGRASRHSDWPIDVTFYIYPELPNLAIWHDAAKTMGLQIEEN